MEIQVELHSRRAAGVFSSASNSTRGTPGVIYLHAEGLPMVAAQPRIAWLDRGCGRGVFFEPLFSVARNHSRE